MKKEISASEAAGILGVSMATLYSYVSRGLLHSLKQGQARNKVYALDEVLRLAARRSDAKHGGHPAQSAITWGLPLLETSISQIAHGALYYRGHRVEDLADWSTLEQTACLLWDDGCRDYFSADHVPLLTAFKRDFSPSQIGSSPLLRLMAAIPFLSTNYHNHQQTPVSASKSDFDFAAYLMRQITALLVDGEASNQAMHLQIAQAWQCDALQTELIRCTLILLADHELNASSFAVRCVASTGADVSLSLGAGLAAYSGPKHGGGSAVVIAFLDGAQHADSLVDFVSAYFAARDPSIAGFGHPLYPQGDPRAAYLLQRLHALAVNCPRLRDGLSFCAEASKQLQLAPNMDCLLALMSWAYFWPQFATNMLFVSARSAAWIAHAFEQQSSGILIRPRARYVGKYHDD